MSISARSLVARAVALSLVTSLAQQSAQAAQPQALTELPEVQVTAQKRVQDVQDVPIAISAFSGDTLQEKGLGDINSLTNLTPNVNLDSGSPFSGDSSVLSASIRGIGQDDFAFNLDPGVGVYLDGVYLARTIGANQNLLDVDRIEILKGPQGTLFGRNTIGGAINIVTHTPGTERRIIATVTTGEFDRRDLAFTADLPVSENLLTSISVSSQVRDGYQKVIDYPTTSLLGSTAFVVDPATAFPKGGYATSNANGSQNAKAFRGKALWSASDSVTVTLAADWTKQDQSATPTTILSVFTPAGNNLPTVADTGATAGGGFMGALYNYCISTPLSTLDDMGFNDGLFNTTYGLCSPRGQGLGLAAGGAALGGAGYVSGPGSANNLLSNQPRIYWNFANTQTGNIDTTYSTGPSFAKYNARGLSGTVDFELPSGMLLKSITGWRDIDWRVGVDLDGTPETILEVSDHQHQKQISQEFQLSGRSLGDKLDWVTGLYYFQEKGYVYDFVPFGGALMIYDVANDVDTKSYAAFAHLDYALTDKWGLTLGGRYSRDNKKFEGGQADLNGYGYKSAYIPGVVGPCNPGGVPDMACWATFAGIVGLAPFPDDTNPYRYFPAGTQSEKYNVFTPTAGVQFHPTDDVMIYTSYSKGFKAGGWTTRLSNPVADISEAAFGPEKANTVELGLKSRLLDRHVQANVAVFQTKYNGIQLNIQEGASPVLQNAGNATLKGAELELQALTGTGLALNLTAGYIDAYYTYVSPSAASQGITVDNKLPKTAKYKYTIGPQYDFTLPNGGRMRMAVDYTNTDHMYNDSINTPELYRPSVSNLNATIHYFTMDDRYQVTLGATNLGDKRYVVVGSSNGAEGQVAGTYSRPREWYATLRVNLE